MLPRPTLPVTVRFCCGQFEIIIRLRDNRRALFLTRSGTSRCRRSSLRRGHRFRGWPQFQARGETRSPLRRGPRSAGRRRGMLWLSRLSSDSSYFAHVMPGVFAVLLSACGGGGDGDTQPAPAPPDSLATYREQTMKWEACDISILGIDDEVTRARWRALGDRVRCTNVRVPLD